MKTDYAKSRIFRSEDYSRDDEPLPTITIRWRDYDKKMHLESWLLCVDAPFAGYQEFPLPDPMSLLMDQLPENPTAANLLGCRSICRSLTVAVICRIAEEYCDDGFEYYGCGGDGCCDAWERVYETVTCTDVANPIIEEWLRTELSEALFDPKRTEVFI